MKWHKRFFWLLLLFLPTQLGFHFWPEWAMVLGRRVDYLSPTFYVTDIIIAILLCSWFFEFRPRLSIRIAIPVLLFAVLNIWIAKNQPVAIYKWLKAVEFVLLGWYIVRTKPKLSAISFPLSVGVLYSSILAIAQFYLQHSVGGLLWWLGERTFDADTPGIARIAINWSLGFGIWDFGLKLRPYATFPHPNVLGGYLAVTLPIVLIRLLGRIRHLGDIKKLENFFYGGTFAMGIVALLLTFSRSAIVIGILALVFVFFQKKKIFFSLAILFLTFSVFRFPFTFFEESVVVRQQLNVAATKLWQTSPLFGVGLGNFLVRLPEELPTRTIYFLQPVHNIYLLLLAEIGIVGIGLIVFCIATLLNHESGIMKYGKGKTKFIIHTSLFIILLLGLIDHYPLSLQQGQLLLTVLAGMSLTFVH